MPIDINRLFASSDKAGPRSRWVFYVKNDPTGSVYISISATIAYHVFVTEAGHLFCDGQAQGFLETMSFSAECKPESDGLKTSDYKR